MAYCILGDIIKLIPEDTLIQLTDDEETGEVAQARVDEAIAQADSEIDSYLESNYSVPLAPVPGLLRKFSVDMAIYNLYSRKVEEVPKTRAERYQNAIRILEKISEGKLSIGDPEAAASGDEAPQVSAADRIFTRDKLEGF